MSTAELQNRVIRVTQPSRGAREPDGSYADYVKEQPSLAQVVHELDGSYAVYVSASLPVDYLLGLAADAEAANRFATALAPLSTVGIFGKPEDTHRDSVSRLRRWKRNGTADRFLTAARAGEKGRLDPAIASHLSRVRFGPQRAVDAPDLLALAAWSLHELVTKGGGYEVRDCELCKLPFLASPRARYCKRLAPDSHEQSCQDYAKVRDFRTRRKAKGEKRG